MSDQALLVRRARTGNPPASFAQHRLWLHDRMGAGAAYNVAGALHLSGRLDVAALQVALEGLTQRHETLRTSLEGADGVPVQRIAPSVRLPLERIDLRSVPAAERQEQVERALREQTALAFDLSRAPLMRAALLVLSDREHVLSMTLHHAITDGWSMERVLPLELKRCYEAVLANAPIPAPEFEVQYADFALWQRERHGAGEDGGQLAFWRRHLAGLSPLELPTDRPRPPVQVFRSATHPFRIPPRLAAALQPLGRAAGYTPAMLMLGAWKLLLARYTGQEDLTVGTLNASRPQAATEPLIGNFVRTLAVRTDLSGDPRFLEELMPRVREASLLAYEHQDVPFERVVEELNPARDPSRHPLFQVMFGMQYVPSSLEARLGELTARALRLPMTRTGVDLDLRFLEEGGRLDAQLAYDTELFEPATIERMAAHFVRLLEGLAANPSARISELSLLTAAERATQVGDWNATDAELGADLCVHELFGEQATRTPEAVALVEGGRELSFRQLAERAEQVSQLLGARGIGPGAVVALCTERSFDSVVGMLGILAAGAAYLPLDPALPERRLRFLLSDSGAALVLTQARLLGVVPEAVERVALDRPLPPASPASAEPHPGPRRVTPGHPAYVIYTSGSTGTPKGVIGLHRGLVNRLRWQWSVAPWRAGEVACHKSSASFVDSLAEVLGGLCAGIRTVLLSEATVIDPHSLVAALARERVTRLLVVPSHLATILDSVPDLGARLPHLAHWTSSGERLPGRLAARLLEQFPRATLWNLYGSTEVSADATWHEVRAGTLDPVADGPAALPGGPADVPPDVPIGRPLANLRCYVLDRWRQPVPAGLPGELFVGGVGLSGGYLNRPDLTAERFVPDPFTTTPGARLFATGDRVRQRPDGVLEFFGRRDDQIALRGFRIELGEVEFALLGHPRVARAAAVERDGRLLAYVVLEGGSASPAELRGFLRQRLPGYMVPADVVALDRLPETPSGKLDRAALPAPARGARSVAPAEGPRDPLELQLVRIWERVLGVERVALDDDFFELGGHSLLAIGLFDRIEAQLGRQLPLATLFSAPTVRLLAEALRDSGWSARWSALVPVQHEGHKRPFFCVPPSAGVLEFHELGRRFTRSRPLYGFEHRGLHGDDPPDTSIAAMAERYVRELRGVQPEGPYHLGGHSFGGIVALEMAQQLVASGQTVAALIILDTLNPPRPSAHKGPAHYLRRSVHHARERRLTELLRKNAREAVRLIKPRFKLLQKPRRIRNVLIAHARARRAYGPQRYPGRAILIQTDEGLRRENHLGWAQVCAGGLQRHALPGVHLELLAGDNLGRLLETLERCLDECER